jgi:Na+-transporting NADH:ubiquinone oxidoreductase subunit A
MADFNINKGFDIKLAGRPATDVTDLSASRLVSLYPLDFIGVKQRLKVSEGDTVKRGAELLEDKRNEAFKLCAPAGGTVKSIIRGHRRFVERITIEVGGDEQAEDFGQHAPDEISGLERTRIMDLLIRTGYLAFIVQRPFSRFASVDAQPKSIFVNGMNTGPFQADAAVAAGDDPQAFQAGLDMLGRLTEGAVHLCIAPGAADVLKSARNVQVHTFNGPHPAGNTSVHINRVDPMRPTDVVWTVKAVDLVLMGRLLLDGVLPTSRVVSLGGSAVKPEACRHYRLRIGAELQPLLSESLVDGECRVINGDVLSGTKIDAEGGLRFYQSAITVIPEGRERHFLGWTAPGSDQYSFTRTVVSSWLSKGRDWSLGTNRHGGKRAMVLTGHYDKVLPLDILVDYLVRAVLAGDTDEAIKLGILETDPEDFALCEFICPCKTEIQQIIRRGLDAIEEEGI